MIEGMYVKQHILSTAKGEEENLLTKKTHRLQMKQEPLCETTDKGLRGTEMRATI